MNALDILQMAIVLGRQRPIGALKCRCMYTAVQGYTHGNKGPPEACSLHHPTALRELH